MTLLQPSQGTLSVWGTRARYAIRLELVISALCLLSLPFVVALSAGYGAGLSTAVLDLPGVLVTLAFSSSAMFCFSRRTLHPVYTLCVAIFLLLVWVVDLFFVFLFDASDVKQYYDSSPVPNFDQHWLPSPSLLILKDIVFVLIWLTILVYIGVSSSAVNAWRGRRGSIKIMTDADSQIEMVARGAHEYPDADRGAMPKL